MGNLHWINSTMIDYILKFPSKEAAQQFGFANGFAVQGVDGDIVSRLASHEHALYEIGEHFVTNKTDTTDESEFEVINEQQALIGDGQYWVLFRDLVGIPIPTGGEAFIYWSSGWTVLDEDGNETAIPRPVNDPNVPNVWWA